MKSPHKWILTLAMLTLSVGCGSSSKQMQPTMEPLPVAQAEPNVLTENHFRSDRSGNLTEDQLREILESPIFLEEDTRLGIVPVATAYEVDTEVPVESVPAELSGALEKTGWFEVTTEVSTDWPKATSITGLRELAARYRAKYLLLYRHRFVERSRANGWSWTYPTVVGAFVVPGTTYEVAGVMEATLFDPRTGTILFTAFERVDAEVKQNIWHRRHKRAELKRELLEDGTGKLAQTVSDKVGRLVSARPDDRKREVAVSK